MMAEKMKLMACRALVPILRRVHPYRFFSANLPFTTACNAACRMCPKSHHERRPALSLDEKTLEAALSQFKRMGFRDINIFNMTEPLMHPRFNEFVDKIVGRGFRVNFSSNGGMLKEGHYSSLAKAHGIGFSIEGYDDKTVRYYRGVSFTALREGIAGFREITRPKELVLRTIVYRDMGEDYIRRFIDVWGPLFDEIVWGVAYPPELVCGNKTGAQRSKDREYFTFVRDKGQRCASGKLGVVILPDGEVIPCCYDYSMLRSFGNIHETPFREILRSKALAEFVRKARTNIDNICGDCAAYFKISEEDGRVYERRVKFARQYFNDLRQS